MEFEQPLDHRIFWAGDAQMESETRNYQNAARAIMRGGMFKKETRHPWMEGDLRNNCPVRITEFADSHGEAHVPFGIRDLYAHYETKPADLQAGKTHRRLIVCEDMDPRTVELLGVKLTIPPVFFLAHCDEFVNLSIVDNACAKQSCSRYWRVPVPQSRRIPESFQGKPGRYVVSCGNLDRLEVDINAETRFIDFHSQVSYWGHKESRDSWTAVLLVDPHKTSIRLKDSDPRDPKSYYDLEDYIPGRNLFTEATVNPLDGGSSSQSWTTTTFYKNYETPIFTAIKDMHARSSIAHTQDPFSATGFTRNLIRSCWEEWIYRRSTNFNDWIFNDERLYRGTGALGSLTGQDNKTVKQYYEWMKLRQYVKEDRKLLRSIIWAFRCKDTDYHNRQAVQQNRMRQQTRLMQQERMKHDEKTMELNAIEKGSQTTDILDGIEQEIRLWDFLEEKLEVMEADIGDWMEMYSQRAGMEESFAANRQARSAGQLTKLATAVVPFSTVASIFSMGDEFAAGKRLFFVFWAICIPVTLALLAWVLQEDIKGWFEIRRRKSDGAAQGKPGRKGPKFVLQKPIRRVNDECPSAANP